MIAGLIAAPEGLEPFAKELAYVPLDLDGIEPLLLSRTPEAQANLPTLRVVHAADITDGLLDLITGRPFAGRAFERYIASCITQGVNLTPVMSGSVAAVSEAGLLGWEGLMGTIAKAWIETGKNRKGGKKAEWNGGSRPENRTGFTQGIERGLSKGRAEGRSEGQTGMFLRLPALRFRAVITMSALLLAGCGGGESFISEGPLENRSRMSFSLAQSVEGFRSDGFGAVAARKTSSKPGHGRILKRSLIAPPVVYAAAAEGDTPGPASASSRYLQQDSERKRNMSAADLRTSWNDTRPVAETLGLASPTTARAGTLKSALGRLKASHADAAKSAAALPKVPIESITVLGERSGIAYGAWKGGPAGTLPFTFHFGPHETSSGKGFVDRKKSGGASEDFMAVLRRSTKIWSKRLPSDGKRRDVTVEDGTKFKDVEGVVVQIRFNDNGRVSAGPRAWDRGADGDKFIPYYGNIRISSHVHNNLHDGIVDTVAHEVGHVLGIVPTGIKLYSGTYYDPQSHTWSGPNAKRANGGKPVPMQWVNENRWWEVKEPHADGARRDMGHPGVCSSLMAYCSDRYDGGAPSELDFAFLADLGYDLLDPKVAAETERYGYAAWGDWAAWGVSVERDLRDNYHETPHDFTQAHADAFGTAPAAALSDSAALPSRGKAVWNGSLLGVDLGRDRLPPVVGNAKMKVDLGTLDGVLLLNDLTVHLGGGGNPIRTLPFRKSALRYKIDITGNGFADADSRVQGNFFGQKHQEMAGVVKDIRPQVELLGGFGGVRAND